MFAKKLTVVLMSLNLLGFANSAVADVRIPLSAIGGVRSDYSAPTNIFAVIKNIYTQYSDSLSRQDQETHTKTVLIAVSYLDNGDIATWSNPETNTAGRIKIIFTKPVQGGICRLLSTEVEKDSQIKQYSELACKTIDNQYWTFASR